MSRLDNADDYRDAIPAIRYLFGELGEMVVAASERQLSPQVVDRLLVLATQEKDASPSPLVGDSAPKTPTLRGRIGTVKPHKALNNQEEQ
jgi:hypothetical protein